MFPQICGHLQEEHSEAYLKEGQGSGSDLAVTKHDACPPYIALPLGLCFVTLQSLSTPIQADYSHCKFSTPRLMGRPLMGRERPLMVRPLMGTGRPSTGRPLSGRPSTGRPVVSLCLSSPSLLET